MSLKLLAAVIIAVLGTVAVHHITRPSEHHTKADSTLFRPFHFHNNQSHFVPNYVLMFQTYKLRNNLKFGAAEDSKRLQVFISNAKLVETHNAKNNTSYKLGITDLAHLTLEEFSALKLGYNGVKRVNATRRVANATNVTIPATVDWSKEGAVTPIKNQGQCGSCWAFSSTGALEGLNFIKGNHKLESFSEQQLVDCSTSYGNQGCDGGLMDQAFAYVAKNGIALESAYPYTGADGTCQKFTPVFFNKGSVDVTANDTDALVAAIAQQPVSVAIEADTFEFQLYSSGVLTGDACGTNLDHGVLAVGYGTLDGQAYIKVKNSWGASWGLDGFVLIGQATGAGVCGINSDPSYPTL